MAARKDFGAGREKEAGALNVGLPAAGALKVGLVVAAAGMGPVTPVVLGGCVTADGAAFRGGTADGAACLDGTADGAACLGGTVDGAACRGGTADGAAS